MRTYRFRDPDWRKITVTDWDSGDRWFWRPMPNAHFEVWADDTSGGGETWTSFRNGATLPEKYTTREAAQAGCEAAIFAEVSTMLEEVTE